VGTGAAEDDIKFDNKILNKSPQEECRPLSPPPPARSDLDGGGATGGEALPARALQRPQPDLRGRYLISGRRPGYHPMKTKFSELIQTSFLYNLISVKYSRLEYSINIVRYCRETLTTFSPTTYLPLFLFCFITNYLPY
jgi:hypothetical protein